MKKIFIGIIIFSILALTAFIIIISSHQNNMISNTNSCQLYFLNVSNNKLQPENKTLTASTDVNKVIEILQYLLVSGPTSQELSIVGKNLDKTQRIYTDIEVQNDTVNLYFNDEYNKLSLTEKIFLKSSITYSLTSIDSISNVVFYNNNKIIYIDEINKISKFNRSNVTLDPSIDPTDMINTIFKLYFSDTDKKYLVQENRPVRINPNNTLESYIMEELIKGTDDETKKNIIPKGTKVLNIKTDPSNKTCYVSLSSDFVTKQSEDTLKRKLAVYSIVNSLTNLDSIDSVKILIDSMKSDVFGKDLDLTNALSPDESFVTSK